MTSYHTIMDIKTQNSFSFWLGIARMSQVQDVELSTFFTFLLQCPVCIKLKVLVDLIGLEFQS